MNRFLADILAQPEVLQLVLADLAGSKRASLVRAAALESNVSSNLSPYASSGHANALSINVTCRGTSALCALRATSYI